MIYAKQNKRKNYFIKKKFQSIFILRFCLLMALGLVLSGVALYFISKSSVTTSFVSSRLAITNTADYILPAIIWAGLSVFFLIGLITILALMHLSHRIAGAMFRIERSVERISAGDLTCEIKLRSSDQAQEMAKSINKMTASLKSYILQIKEESAKVDGQIERLVSLAKDDTIKSDLEKLSKQKRELNKLLEHFKVDSYK